MNLYQSTDRRLAYHVRLDGTIDVVVSCPRLDYVVSRMKLINGWQYAHILIGRIAREWDGLTYQVIVTFEVAE